MLHIKPLLMVKAWSKFECWQLLIRIFVPFEMKLGLKPWQAKPKPPSFPPPPPKVSPELMEEVEVLEEPGNDGKQGPQI